VQIADALALLATYEASRDLIDMGAYQRGANPRLDRAIEVAPNLERSLRQEPGISLDRREGYETLAAILAAQGGVA
jgi:flagellum-specific ATP synthase